MNTKLSIVFLSGLSVCLSMGAFAVADGVPADYINWSYAMGETQPMAVAGQPDSYEGTASNNVMLADNQVGLTAPVNDSPQSDITCTEGCPGRPDTKQKPLVLTYEDEAAPLAERVDTFAVQDHFDEAQAPISVRAKMKKAQVSDTFKTSWEKAPTAPAQAVNIPPQIDTHYVESASNVQYPITRQYPISVQYPVTIQRNMTVEQPVIMQQPVIVRRPVVMQQDITVQRQPTVIQHQPVVMQQQPTFVQQQPVYVQAPAGAINPAVLSGLNQLPPPAIQPMPTVFPAQPQQIQQPMTIQPSTLGADIQPVPTVQASVIPGQPEVRPSLPMVQSPYLGQPQQYQVQGQIQAQPVYTPTTMYAPMPQSVMPGTLPSQPMY